MVKVVGIVSSFHFATSNDGKMTRCQYRSEGEGDNHLVELAVAGAASCIVTRNLRDFREMELRFPNLRVLSPEDQLKELSHFCRKPQPADLMRIPVGLGFKRQRKRAGPRAEANEHDAANG